MKIKTAKALVEAHSKLTDEQFAAAIEGLNQHQKDLLIPCPVKLCSANEGEECRGHDTKRGIVHFGRRVKRLLKGIR